MQRYAASITTVAAERIAEELRKLLQAAAPSHGFRLMQDTGLLSHILPEIAHLVGPATVPAPLSNSVVAQEMTAGDDAFRRTLRRLDALQQEEVVIHRGHLDLLLAALFQDSGRLHVALSTMSPSGQTERVAQASATLAGQRLEALKVTTIGARLEVIKRLISVSATDSARLKTAPALRHFMHRFNTETTFLIFDLWLADRIANGPSQTTDDLLLLRQRFQEALAHHVPLRLQDLALNGHDLQRLGIPPGPQMGRILQALLQRVLDDPACNTHAALLSVVQSEFAHLVPTLHRQPPETPM
jgi:tRNA nucleotidyltransferase (CCA-adding enzyme)